MAPPRPSTPASPPSPAWAALLDASSDLLAWLDAGGCILWINQGFERATGHAAADVIGRAVVPLLRAGSAGAAARDPDPWQAVQAALVQHSTLARLALPWIHRTGRVCHGELSLTPWAASAGDGAPEGARWHLALHDDSGAWQLTQRLDTAQRFGRLALWERDLPGGPSRWDAHMFRFFGLDPAQDVPDAEAIAGRIHRDDQSNHPDALTAQPAGCYDTRYRIALPGEPPRHIHAQWEVRNGPDGEPALATGVLVDDTEAYALAQSFQVTSEQLRMAVELGNISIWRHDLRADCFHFDERGSALIGLPPRVGGVPAAEVFDQFHPDDADAARAAGHALHEIDRPIDLESRIRMDGGGWRTVLSRRVMRRDEQGAPLEAVVVALDISEQVKQRREAGEMAHRLETAAAASGMGIWGRNPETGLPEWNAQMFEIVGRPSELGLPSRREWVEEIIHPDDRVRMRTAHEEMLASTGAMVEHQYRIVRPDGQVRWLVNRSRHDIRHGRSLLFGVTMDLTDRMETEAALRQANERVALATHGAGIGTWDRDVRTDWVEWDAQMYALRGLTPDAGGSNQLRLSLCHPDDLPHIVERNAASIASGRMATYEFRVRQPDGSYRWLASRSVPVYDAQGVAVRQIGVNWDIHERVMAEAERMDRVVAERENHAKSQFLARMSHELRTPLNAVLGFTQLLQLTGDWGTEQREKLNHIHDAGQHLLTLINDVLDLSSLDDGRLKLDIGDVALGTVVKEALPLVQGLAQRHGITLDLGPLPGTVKADRTRVRQVVLNLLSNAIKYNRPRGRVSLTTEVEDAFVSLTVLDTGRGMTRTQMAGLFEPFNRLGRERENIEGTGIGLSLVKALLERMGGAVDVSSQPGLGSRFVVRLPRVIAPTPAPRATAQPAPARLPSARRSGQVLYIEDNPVNQLLVEELVRSHAGLTIESSGTGLLGVERARALRPDLILVDIQLPDIDGFEVLQRLRNLPETAAIPCIALSANAMPEDIARAREAGFADYWTKPIVFAAFLEALDRLFPTEANTSPSVATPPLGTASS